MQISNLNVINPYWFFLNDFRYNGNIVVLPHNSRFYSEIVFDYTFFDGLSSYIQIIF